MPNNYGPPLAERRQPVAKDERSWGGNAMYRLYETRDGRFVALGGAEIKFATNLLSALGRPDLIALCQLPPGPGQQPVRDFLEQTFRTKTQDEWVAWMADKDVAFAPVKTACARASTTRRSARARWWSRTSAAGSTSACRSSSRTSPAGSTSALPERGEHSEAILRALGYDDAELGAMKAKGVF